MRFKLTVEWENGKPDVLFAAALDHLSAYQLEDVPPLTGTPTPEELAAWHVLVAETPILKEAVMKQEEMGNGQSVDIVYVIATTPPEVPPDPIVLGIYGPGVSPAETGTYTQAELEAMSKDQLRAIVDADSIPVPGGIDGKVTKADLVSAILAHQSQQPVTA